MNDIGAVAERLARYGVAMVLSMINGKPAPWAISASVSRSVTAPPGLTRLSAKIALVRSVIAAFMAGSSVSTKLQCQSNF